MIKTYGKDIICIGLSALIIIISFFPIEDFISREIPILKVIWIWDKLDIYSLVLIPIAILFYTFGKLRISLTIVYSYILIQFHFFRNLPLDFQNHLVSTLAFIIALIAFISVVYFFSNDKYIRKKSILNCKYVWIVNYILIAVALFIASWEFNTPIASLIYVLLLASIILTAIHNPKNWKIRFLIFSTLSIVIQTFYLGCYTHYYGDVGLLDFSINNMWTNCSKNYLWLISGLIILYMTINKINTLYNKTV